MARAQAPDIAPPNATTSAEPWRSIHQPTAGETATAKTPPKLTAPAKTPLDQPSSSVIGTKNTARVATAIIGLDEKLVEAETTNITHP